jgi:phosphate transport system protein
MSIHLQREMNTLKKKILTMSAMVQDTISEAVQSLNVHDTALADKVIESDSEIDHLELEIEEDSLKILALYNPVANDLRFVIAVLKINNDLERMADLAVNIAERSKHLATAPKISIPKDLFVMAEIVQQMLRNTLNSLIQLDTGLARQVIDADDQVDEIHKKMYELVQSRMCEHPQAVSCQISLLSVSRNLERIADQITNIAEDVIYLVEGHLVRHAKGLL